MDSKRSQNELKPNSYSKDKLGTTNKTNGQQKQFTLFENETEQQRQMRDSKNKSGLKIRERFENEPGQQNKIRDSKRNRDRKTNQFVLKTNRGSKTKFWTAKNKFGTDKTSSSF